ncbi:MAG: hypothetical protein ACTSXA_13655 [Candidatus Heimdallarchaeota archaeon]
MAKYVIKKYEKGFEVDQERIGNEVALTFLQPHQTRAEFLKERYSQEDFDSETRLYAFKDDEMVGFLTSRVLEEQEDGVKRASLTPPSVLSKHAEVNDILFNQATEILTKKGVQQIQSFFGSRSDKNEDDAKKWGYNKVSTNHFLYKIEIEKLDMSVSTEKISKFSFEKHQKAIATVMAEEYERDFEWANAFFERIKTQELPKRFQYVIEEDDKIMAYAGISLNNIKQTCATIFAIRAENPEYMKSMLTKVAQVAKKEKIEQLTIGFTEESDIEKEKFKGIPFKLIGSTSLFTKDLE